MTSKQSEDATMQFQQLRQQLQNVLMQNERTNIQIMEIDKALTELKTSGEEVYKLAGTILIKGEKGKLTKELSEQKEELEVRVKTLQKHEQTLKDKLQKLQEELMKEHGKEAKKKSSG